MPGAQAASGSRVGGGDGGSKVATSAGRGRRAYLVPRFPAVFPSADTCGLCGFVNPSIRPWLYLYGYDQISVGLLFWDLGVMVGSNLWLRSGYVPRALAAFGILASVWCAVCALGLYVVPDFPKRVSVTWYDTPVALFEIALSFVLPFRGPQPARIAEREPLGSLGA